MLQDKQVRRRVLKIAVPALIAVLWIGGWQVWRFTAPQPRWTVAALPREQYVGSCDDLARAAVETVAPDSTGAARAGEGIGPGRAARIGDRVLSRYHWRPSPLLLSGGPGAATIVLPDGTTRAVWYVAQVVEHDRNMISGQAAIVYLDAVTGEPLVYVPDAMIDDFITSACINILMPMVARLVLFNGVIVALILAGAIILVRSYILHRRQSEPT